ncbi:MAG: hypothetical protein KZQ64_13935 [gamma proteobacterium symbiont of Bathyaustriella thionipta]|nr:hypothetical protein [gamma proteobacterium symbiont of Bathyaustriella thionipta]MCU7949294.1 hypothetical protein [gamma proteobacterium symbiont of Bathyaustriella thionipta]MCU7954470.1 hypothetical protein [gamma proteobacterium symbiont of Bathyaustriella thionipta]MCU7956067.1 hypothetical protein [gamma proteobacterium symbiont of Bathyaustriella thionipta]MCU7968485.1 hypothetical protein [gamma proteobacterium symbiont of Bathyaustriella thionipta]
MNFEKVSFAFFVVFALTINFGFFIGDIDNPSHHHVFELFAAIVISLIATIIKLGDRSHIGAVLLATSLVADIHLLVAAIIWGIAEHVASSGVTPDIMATIVSVSGGALIANLTSVVLLVIETVVVRR